MIYLALPGDSHPRSQYNPEGVGRVADPSAKSLGLTSDLGPLAPYRKVDETEWRYSTVFRYTRLGAAAIAMTAAGILAGCTVGLRMSDGGIGLTRVTLTDTRVDTFDASGLAAIRMELRNGRIDVQAWDRAEVQVTLEKKVHAATDGQARSRLAELDVTWERSGNMLIGSTVPTRPELFGGGATHVTIRAPRAVHLALTTRNGAITAAGVAGQLELETFNGRIAVRGEAATEPATLVTRNGSLELSGYAGGGRLETRNGGITVTAAEQPGARFHMFTRNGSITAFGSTLAGRGDPVTLSTGGGGPLFQLETDNGSIRLDREK